MEHKQKVEKELKVVSEQTEEIKGKYTQTQSKVQELEI